MKAKALFANHRFMVFYLARFCVSRSQDVSSSNFLLHDLVRSAANRGSGLLLFSICSKMKRDSFAFAQSFDESNCVHIVCVVIEVFYFIHR